MFNLLSYNKCYRCPVAFYMYIPDERRWYATPHFCSAEFFYALHQAMTYYPFNQQILAFRQNKKNMESNMIYWKWIFEWLVFDIYLSSTVYIPNDDGQTKHILSFDHKVPYLEPTFLIINNVDFSSFCDTIIRHLTINACLFNWKNCCLLSFSEFCYQDEVNIFNGAINDTERVALNWRKERNEML